MWTIVKKFCATIVTKGEEDVGGGMTPFRWGGNVCLRRNKILLFSGLWETAAGYRNNLIMWMVKMC